MKYHTFQPEFHVPIKGKIKRSTIRGSTKVKVGEVFALRYWTGSPYRSPMGILGTATCTGIFPVRVGQDGVKSDYIAPEKLANIATTEGFTDWPAMLAWFAATHPLPFLGLLISWGNFREQS